MKRISTMTATTNFANRQAAPAKLLSKKRTTMASLNQKTPTSTIRPFWAAPQKTSSQLANPSWQTKTKRILKSAPTLNQIPSMNTLMTLLSHSRSPRTRILISLKSQSVSPAAYLPCLQRTLLAQWLWIALKAQSQTRTLIGWAQSLSTQLLRLLKEAVM